LCFSTCCFAASSPAEPVHRDKDRKTIVPLAFRSLREHLAIIAACRNRNSAEAQAALQTHFANAMQRKMGLY